MNAEFFDALDELEKLKGIPKDYMVEKVVVALTNAFKKETGADNVRVAIDPVKRDIKVYRQRTVVEEVTNPKTEISLEEAKAISKRNVVGKILENEVKTKNFGRLSAQAAKNVIVQAIRETERANTFREYEKKREEIITAIVTKSADETGAVMIDTGTSEAPLIQKEQIPGETFEVGDRIKVFVTEVKRPDSEGSIVTLSRTHPGLVKKLFELEIPEIADGTVVIKHLVREAGSRTKIAVCSEDPDVDAVGACIGNHGMRIGSIVNELRGEKIDIIEYSDNLGEFIARSLSPATISSVEFESEKSAKVYVANDQLSLTIGKEGQNARLSARLTGCKIDIKGV